MQAEYCICGKGMIISGDMFEYGNIAQYDVTAQTGVLSGIAGYQFSLGGETLDAIVVG